MRPSSLLVQSLVLISLAALIGVASQAEFMAPKALRPLTDLSLERAASVDQLPRSQHDGVASERTSARALRVVDRTTGGPVPQLDLYWLPMTGETELRLAATSDDDGVAIVTVRGEGEHVLGAWLGSRSIRPTGVSHGLLVIDRPQVVHLAETATVRGRFVHAGVPTLPVGVVETFLQIPFLGASDAENGEAGPVTRLRSQTKHDGTFEFNGVPTEVEGITLCLVDNGDRLIASRPVPMLTQRGSGYIEFDLATLPQVSVYGESAYGRARRKTAPFELPDPVSGSQVLRGVLIDRKKNPIPHTTVAMFGAGRHEGKLRWRCEAQLPASTWTTQTDEQGRFEFTGIGDARVFVGLRDVASGLPHWFRRYSTGPRVQTVRLY